MKYLLSHRTSYTYASSVDSAHHIAHLRAREFPGQKVTGIGIETNPAPAKYALSVLGKCSDIVRLPMVPLAERSKTAVREAMVHAGLIN